MAGLGPSFRCAGSLPAPASVYRPPLQRTVCIYLADLYDGRPGECDRCDCCRCRVPFWTGNSGSKPPSLANSDRYCSGKRPLCSGKLGRTQGGNPRRQQLARQRWGATGGTGAASSARCVMAGVAPLTGRPPGRGAHTEAGARRPRTQADLHIEFELSGPMPHFSGAMVWLIGIGGHLTVPPLPHHRAYVSRTTAVRPG